MSVFLYFFERQKHNQGADSSHNLKMIQAPNFNFGQYLHGLIQRRASNHGGGFAAEAFKLIL